jgi:diaminopimelate dehydrogenase
MGKTMAVQNYRVCYVVLKDGADAAEVERQIKEMPNYFAPYETTVKFVTQEELDRDYASMPHDGIVIAAGETSPGNSAVIKYSCNWASNPEGTAGILVAHARAAHRLATDGKVGAFTPLDIPPALLSPHSQEELLAKFM